MSWKSKRKGETLMEIARKGIDVSPVSLPERLINRKSNSTTESGTFQQATALC